MERLTDRGFRFNAWREAPKERKDVPSVENVYLRLQELENMIEDGYLVKRVIRNLPTINEDYIVIHPDEVQKSTDTLDGAIHIGDKTVVVHKDDYYDMMLSSRPKGKWLNKHASHYECSNCGEWVDKSWAWRYCTHCGSDNRKKERGEE